MGAVTERYNIFYIHNNIGHFYRDTLEYMSSEFYPRFRYKIISTYDKAVEYMNIMKRDGKEQDKPNIPAIIMNPTGDFTIAEYSKQFFRFANLSPSLVSKLYYPIYQDENILIVSAFTRIEGDIEFTFLFDSFYEYCDIKMYLLQLFGGFDRIIYPLYFKTFVIIPEELYNFQYVNDITGESYKLDWTSSNVENQLIRTTNTNEYVFPCNIRPWYKLISLSDASNRYGGTDKLAEWKLNATVKYEVELPTFVVLDTDYLVKSTSYYIKSGSIFSRYDYQPPDCMDILKSNYEYPYLDSTSSITDLLQDPYADSTTTCEATIQLCNNEVYYHIITQEEVDDTTSDIIITIEESVPIEDALIINYKYGKMTGGIHYTYENIDNKTCKITIFRYLIENLLANEAIEIYTYEIVNI